MPLQIAPVELHPQGEVLDPRAAAARAILSRPLAVDTLGRRFHVEWDTNAPVTPWASWPSSRSSWPPAGSSPTGCASARCVSPVPTRPDSPTRLGTVTLALLAGQNRYAHVTALRADSVNPQGLGIGKVCSEDSVRRAFADAIPPPAPHGSSNSH